MGDWSMIRDHSVVQSDLSLLVHGVERRSVPPRHGGHGEDGLLADGGVLLLAGHPLKDQR